MHGNKANLVAPFLRRPELVAMLSQQAEALGRGFRSNEGTGYEGTYENNGGCMDPRAVAVPQDQPVSAAALAHAVRRWFLLIVAAAALGGAGTYVISLNIPPEYRATAQLFLAPPASPTFAAQDVVQGQNLARSYVQLATAEVVLRPAMQQSGSADLNAFRDRLQVIQLRDTSIINITFQDRDPNVAARTANAIADSFIQASRQLQTSLSSQTVSRLDEQIRFTDGEVKSLDTQISSVRVEIIQRPAGTAVRAELEVRLALLDASRQSKQQTLEQLTRTRDDILLAAARAQNTVTLWQPAMPPPEPDSPRIQLNTILGVAAGTLASLLFVVSNVSARDAAMPLSPPRSVPPADGVTTAAWASGVGLQAARVARAMSRLFLLLLQRGVHALTLGARGTLRPKRDATRQVARGARLQADGRASPAAEQLAVDVRVDTAADELRRAQSRLVAREGALGFNHPDVASELHMLAALHHEAGRHETAVALYGTALAIRERTLGPDHPEVASTLEDLAAARRDDGEAEEAERLLSRAQHIRLHRPRDLAHQGPFA